MFLSKNDFRILKARVTGLENQMSKIMNEFDMEVESNKSNCIGYLVSVREVVKQIFDYLGLVMEFIPAKEHKFVLRVKDGKKKQNKKETKEK